MAFAVCSDMNHRGDGFAFDEGENIDSNENKKHLKWSGNESFFYCFLSFFGGKQRAAS